MYWMKLVLHMMLTILKVKILANRIIWEKDLKGRAYKIFRNPYYNGYERELACRVYNTFEVKRGSEVSTNKVVQYLKNWTNQYLKNSKQRKI